jgi:hypothetical protein
MPCLRAGGRRILGIWCLETRNGYALLQLSAAPVVRKQFIEVTTVVPVGIPQIRCNIFLENFHRVRVAKLDAAKQDWSSLDIAPTTCQNDVDNSRGTMFALVEP